MRVCVCLSAGNNAYRCSFSMDIIPIPLTLSGLFHFYFRFVQKAFRSVHLTFDNAALAEGEIPPAGLTFPEFEKLYTKFDTLTNKLSGPAQRQVNHDKAQATASNSRQHKHDNDDDDSDGGDLETIQL